MTYMNTRSSCACPGLFTVHCQQAFLYIYAHRFKWNAKSINQFERESGVIKRHRNIRFSSVPIVFSFFYRNKCMMYWNSSSEQIKSTMKNNFHERLLRKKERKKTELKAISQLTLGMSSIYWDFVYPTLEFFQKVKFE